MSYRLLILCALVALLVPVAQADARATRHITLQINDTFLVAGTDLACQTEVGKHVIKGQKLVTCFKLKGNGLAPKSYIAALGANGRVVVAQITAEGNIGGKPVFDRTPASVRSEAKQITVHAGDELLLSGTDVGCRINNDNAGIYPTCFRVTPKGGRPGSLAFAQTEKGIIILQFDATGKKTKIVFKHLHGS